MKKGQRHLLIRHPETRENLSNILQDQCGGVPSDHGKYQAELFMDWLLSQAGNHNIDFIYCSNAARARVAIKPLLRIHGYLSWRVQYTDDLLEINPGQFVGKGGKEFADAVRVHEQSNDFGTFKPKGGETHAEAMQRGVHFVRQKIVAHSEKNENCAFIAHGSLIKMMLLYFSDTPLVRENYKSFDINNMTASVLHYMRPNITTCLVDAGRIICYDKKSLAA